MEKNMASKTFMIKMAVYNFKYTTKMIQFIELSFIRAHSFALSNCVVDF